MVLPVHDIPVVNRLGHLNWIWIDNAIVLSNVFETY
jgi:hypothetical protein